jgi:hypothetical protein
MKSVVEIDNLQLSPFAFYSEVYLFRGKPHCGKVPA